MKYQFIEILLIYYIYVYIFLISEWMYNFLKAKI